MKRFSPAKLNLFLHITGRRPNGYHNLQSVFCRVDFGDFLTFDKMAKSPNTPLLTLTGADNLTDNVADNLIYKAVHTLARTFPDHAHPLHIHLDKHLPTGAGLGGGSSNCATTLISLNELWDIGLSTDELINIGATLGADVPFFIFAHTHQTEAIVEGIGEQLFGIDLPNCEFLLLMPDAHINTAQFFAKDELKRDGILYAHDELAQVDFYQLDDRFGNVFEPLATQFSPNIHTALTYLKGLEDITCTTARMTGTGSVVFLPTPNINDETKHMWIKNAPCPAIFVKLFK
ncbi:4-(cytidine 5'-diphospho)-2-C-methyl-D-erythritol kinase [Moraxella oblonga]|uniref:4-(cytidine 5'-diphospho)-2-C-methyl-D-erythritol kinase n=1 Tax=Moraxella oblonga TaxID=200413 RepID=UPI0008325DE5|nr:4-(cytidine 5'-diphospho)-2-C-methyl-D-erythritol kinase [Moraxella oblonga]